MVSRLTTFALNACVASAVPVHELISQQGILGYDLSQEDFFLDYIFLHSGLRKEWMMMSIADFVSGSICLMC